jgi:hypothetical protein
MPWIDQVKGNNDVKVELGRSSIDHIVWYENDGSQIAGMGFDPTFTVFHSGATGNGEATLVLNFGKQIEWGHNYKSIESDIHATVEFSGKSAGTATFDDDP